MALSSVTKITKSTQSGAGCLANVADYNPAVLAKLPGLQIKIPDEINATDEPKRRKIHHSETTRLTGDPSMD
jgi:hypothetical protein